MSDKTAKGLVEFCKSKIGTPYVYGMKGFVMSQDNFDWLQATYGKSLVWDSDAQKIGKVCVDCSGLISWYTGIVKGSSQFMAESDLQPMSTIADAPAGVAVWRSGHIGVYIGGGKVIEAKGSKYGTVETNVNDGDWANWFELKDVSYTDDTVPEWAKEHWERAIAKGITDGTDPNGVCTRAMLVTMLGRAGVI